MSVCLCSLHGACCVQVVSIASAVRWQHESLTMLLYRPLTDSRVTTQANADVWCSCQTDRLISRPRPVANPPPLPPLRPTPLHTQTGLLPPPPPTTTTTSAALSFLFVHICVSFFFPSLAPSPTWSPPPTSLWLPPSRRRWRHWRCRGYSCRCHGCQAALCPAVAVLDENGSGLCDVALTVRTLVEQANGPSQTAVWHGDVCRTGVFQRSHGRPLNVQSTTSSRADPSVQMPACLHTVDNFVPCRSVSANARVSSYSRQLRPVQMRQCKCPRVFIQSTTSSRADASVQMPACLHTVDNFVPCRCVSANARVSSYSRQLRPVQIHPSVQMPACLHTVDNFVPCRSIHQCKCPRVFIQSTTSSRADASVQMPACLHTLDNFVPCRSVSANDRVSSHSRQLRPVQIHQCKCPRVFMEQCSSTGVHHHCATVCCCACSHHTVTVV